MVVGAGTRYHSNLMAALGQTYGEIGQVLSRRGDVRVEGLIEEEEGQKKMLKG